MAKPLNECTARERDERWTAAHQAGIRERKAMLEQDMAPHVAEAQAKQMQERVTNQARAELERGR